MDPKNLPKLANFAQIASYGSFSKAAAEMGITRAAASQSLLALEKALNVKLLHRTTRELALTDAGKQLFHHLRPALDSIDAAVRALENEQKKPSGLIKISTCRSAAKYLIEPYITEFLRRYPALTVELVTNDQSSDIIADGCDVGIFLGRSVSPPADAVPLSGMRRMAVVASPSYLKRHGIPRSPLELKAHNCIAHRQSSDGRISPWKFDPPGGGKKSFTIEPRGSYITNDSESLVRAALQGSGLIQHMDYALRGHVNSGALVHVLDQWCKPFPGFFLRTTSTQSLAPKITILKDFLIENRID